MEIKKENIVNAYTQGDDSMKTMLRTMFPDIEFEATTAVDNRPITERVKTFKDACEFLGIDAEVEESRLREAGLCDSDEIAYQKLRIITAALNEGWEPQFREDEYRWYPWFCLWTAEELADKSDEWKRSHALKDFGEYRGEWAGFAFANSHYAPSNTAANIGSRLCYKSEALAVYSGRQFADLWADFYLIRK